MWLATRPYKHEQICSMTARLCFNIHYKTGSKSGTSGKMKSLRLFMSKKCITQAVRLSLENFGVLNFEDRGTKRKISIISLYDVKHIFH